jgi:hypothetical protein
VPTSTATGCPDTLFHQHTTVPALASLLLRQLCQEWVDLNASPDANAAVSRWGHGQPALAGMHSPGAVVDLIDDSPQPVTDRILRALLQLLHGGDQLAGRVLLQAMLPCLTNMARRCRPPRDVSGPDEQLQRAVTEFWSVIARPRPLPRRGIAGRLQLDTLKRFTRHRRSHDAWEEHTTYQDESEYQLELPAGQDADPAAPPDLHLVLDNPGRATGYDPDRGLYELVVNARATGVLTAEEAQFLVDVYLVPDGEQNLAGVARRRGLSPAAVRQRCSRIRARLVAAVVDDLADSGVPGQRAAG